MIDYTTVRTASDRHSEANDCAVCAMTIATGMDYHDIHKLYASKGRKPRAGTPQAMTSKVMGSLKRQGYKFVDEGMPRQKSGSLYTMKTIAKAFPKGTYIVRVRGHMAALVDGKVEDWTDNRRHQVLKVIRVKRPDN